MSQIGLVAPTETHSDLHQNKALGYPGMKNSGI